MDNLYFSRNDGQVIRCDRDRLHVIMCFFYSLLLRFSFNSNNAKDGIERTASIERGGISRKISRWIGVNVSTFDRSHGMQSR